VLGPKNPSAPRPTAVAGGLELFERVELAGRTAQLDILGTDAAAGGASATKPAEFLGGVVKGELAVARVVDLVADRV